MGLPVDFLYVCECIYARGRNFFPIYTKFGTQVGILNSKVQFENGVCGSDRSPLGAPPKNYV